MSEIRARSFVETAIDAVCEASREIADLFRVAPQEMGVTWKSDETPVTKADLLSEKVIRQVMLARFPTLSLLMEEAGGECKTDGMLCLIDPLDGTSSFARGIPTYGILVALAEGTRANVAVVACVVHEPQTGRIWYAVRGEGTHLLYYDWSTHTFSDPRKIRVSSRGLFPPEKSMVIYDAALQFREVVPRVADKMVALNACFPMFRRARMIGSLALQFAYVASGFAEAAVADAVGGPYDLCGHILVDEAGGRTTDLELQPVHIFRTKVAIATNGDRHEELASTLRSAYQKSICSKV